MALKKALPEVVLAINKALPEVLLVIKYSYRKKIWSSNILTGRRSGHQIFLPEEDLVINFLPEEDLPIILVKTIMLI